MFLIRWLDPLLHGAFVLTMAGAAFLVLRATLPNSEVGEEEFRRLRTVAWSWTALYGLCALVGWFFLLARFQGEFPAVRGAPLALPSLGPLMTVATATALSRLRPTTTHERQPSPGSLLWAVQLLLYLPMFGGILLLALGLTQLSTFIWACWAWFSGINLGILLGVHVLDPAEPTPLEWQHAMHEAGLNPSRLLRREGSGVGVGFERNAMTFNDDTWQAIDGPGRSEALRQLLELHGVRKRRRYRSSACVMGPVLFLAGAFLMDTTAGLWMVIVGALQFIPVLRALKGGVKDAAIIKAAKKPSGSPAPVPMIASSIVPTHVADGSVLRQPWSPATTVAAPLASRPHIEDERGEVAPAAGVATSASIRLGIPALEGAPELPAAKRPRWLLAIITPALVLAVWSGFLFVLFASPATTLEARIGLGESIPQPVLAEASIRLEIEQIPVGTRQPEDEAAIEQIVRTYPMEDQHARDRFVELLLRVADGCAPVPHYLNVAHQLDLSQITELGPAGSMQLCRTD